MQTRIVRFGSLLMLVLGAGVVACSSDDSAAPGAGGSGGSAGSGTAGKGGSAGSNAGTAGKGGSSGASGANNGGAGNGGTGGSKADASPDGPKDATGDCNVASISHTAPTVPSNIATPAGVTLIGGYRAAGDQIYTCTPAAATDAGDGGVTGTWVNTATAVIYGDNCSTVGAHSYTPRPGSGALTPTWAYTADGSTVIAARVDTSPAPGAGDAGPTAIPWALLKTVSNSGEGVFANVTYVQRTDTAGGIGPSGACDPTGDAASNVRKAAYTATYYFYTGTGTSAEGGGDASEAGVVPDVIVVPEAAPEGSSTIDAAVEAGGD